jgi:MOSC domain-containing protein YiiM
LLSAPADLHLESSTFPHPVILSLNTAPVRPLGPKAIPSAIAKQPADRPLRLTSLGLAGDEQGDTRVHGGVDKAVHHYPRDHYPAWRADLGDHPLLDAHGAFGENISTLGLTESDVAIGDRFRIGTALVEVSQGRQPCFRLNLRFETPGVALRMQDSGRTGWYYRVIEEGVVAPGDSVQLTDRLAPDWSVERIRRVFYVDMLDREALHAIAALTLLPERWRQLAEKRLASGAVEDWSPRLKGG